MSFPSLAQLVAGADHRLGTFLRRQLFADRDLDYTQPAGDPGLFGPESVTWQVHANPVTLAIGGIAAVLLELSEPRVRTGVWEHTSFRTDPLGRMRRTAEAAMLTTYGPTVEVERRIESINRMHERVRGTTPEGHPYAATDPNLLAWVQVTASYGFLNAHLRYAERALSLAEQDRYYAEAAQVGRRFGADDLPASVKEVERFLHAMRPRLEPHPIIGEFLDLVARTSPFGLPGRLAQPLVVDCSIALLPEWVPCRSAFRPSALRRAAAERLGRSAASLGRLLPNEIVAQARARVGCYQQTS